MSSNLDDSFWQQILNMDPTELLSDDAISSTCDENTAAGTDIQPLCVDMSVQPTTSGCHTGAMTTDSYFSNDTPDQNCQSHSTLMDLSLEDMNNQINVQPNQMTFQSISPPMQGENYVYSNNMINPIRPVSIIKLHGHSIGEMTVTDPSSHVNAQHFVQQSNPKFCLNMHPCMTANSQGPGECQSVHNQSSGSGSNSYDITTAPRDEWILTTSIGESWILKRNTPNPPNSRTNFIFNNAQPIFHTQPQVSGFSNCSYQGGGLQSREYLNVSGLPPVHNMQNMKNSWATQLGASINCMTASPTGIDTNVNSAFQPVGVVSNNWGANVSMGGMGNYIENNSPSNQYYKSEMANNSINVNESNTYGHVGYVKDAISDKQGGTANIPSSLFDPDHQDWMKMTGMNTNLLNNINSKTEMEYCDFPENDGNVHGATGVDLSSTLSNGQQHSAFEGNGTFPVVNTGNPRTTLNCAPQLSLLNGNNKALYKNVCKPTPSTGVIKKLNFDCVDRGEGIGNFPKLASFVAMREKMSNKVNPSCGTFLAQLEGLRQQNSFEKNISLADLQFSEDDDVLSSASSVSCNNNCDMEIRVSQQGTTSVVKMDGSYKTQEMSNHCATDVSDNAGTIQQVKRTHSQIENPEDGRVREEECSDVTDPLPRKSARIHNMKSEGVTCGMCMTAADSTRQDASGGSSSGTKNEYYDDDSELTGLSDTDSDNEVQCCQEVKKIGPKTYSSENFNPEYRQAKRLLADIPYRRWIPDTVNIEENDGPFIPIVTRPATVCMNGRRRRTFFRQCVTAFSPLSKLTYFKELLQSYVSKNNHSYLSLSWPPKHGVYVMSEKKLGYEHIPTLRDTFPVPCGWMMVLGVVGAEPPAALNKNMVVLLCENKWVLLHNYSNSTHELFLAASDLKQFMEEGLSRCDPIYEQVTVPYGVAMENSLRNFLRNSRTFQDLMDQRDNMHGCNWTFNGMPGRLGDRVIHLCNPDSVDSIPADEAVVCEGRPLYFFAYVTTFKSNPATNATVLIAADKDLRIYGYHKGRPRIRYLCKNVQTFFKAGARKFYLDFQITPKRLLAVNEEEYLNTLQNAPCLLLKPSVFRKIYSQEGK
uniref:U95 n=1 Tax=Human betaherpesvirus 6A TaxID=32603 RepID=A0A4P8DZ60_9BETA|nr:U95 [Human betaherpesvirus 6A]